MRNFPYKGFPSGWFQIAFSDEIAPGTVKPLHYFGTDLVLMRTDSGRAVLADAFCPHMGAHLGYGGKIEGENVRCPFHGWCYDTKTGSVSEISYDTGAKPRIGLKVWEVRETMTVLWAWYDSEGAAPGWEPPDWPEATSPDYYAEAPVRRLFPNIAVMPQLVIENVVDPAHQQYIHGAAVPSEFVSAAPDGHTFKIMQNMLFGGRGKKTFLTSEPIQVHLEIEAWGVGIGLVRFHGLDKSIIIHTSTPIDHDRSDMWSAIIVPRKEADFENGELTEKAAKRIAHQMRQVDKDIVIWENMSYVTHPPMVGAEMPTYANFRRWTWQFYPELRDKLAKRNNTQKLETA